MNEVSNQTCSLVIILTQELDIFYKNIGIKIKQCLSYNRRWRVIDIKRQTKEWSCTKKRQSLLLFLLITKKS